MSKEITFVQIPVDLRSLYRLAAQRGWGSPRAFDEGRALHHALSETFGPKAMQPFRLLVPPRRRDAVIYAYSPLNAEELLANREITPPDTQAVFKSSALKHKSLPTHFPKGRRLGFDIRIRPIRRTQKHKSRPKGRVREIDAFLHEALQHPEDKHWMENNERTREAVYTDWLSERLGSAAEMEQGAVLSRFRRTIATRKTGNSEGPDAVIQGTLKVSDTSAFSNMLMNGIGRHKTYGFGMILLRPAGRPPMKG